jgi:hypothetical protein
MNRASEPDLTRPSWRAALWSLAKHPLTTLVVGLLVSVLLFELSQTKKQPVYAVSSPELIASTPDPTHLSILWNGESVPNVYRVSIAFWNSGTQYIDSGDLSSADPWRIVLSGSKSQVLSATVTSRSRSTLHIEVVPKTPIVGLILTGDDALEKNDGAVVQLLYTGVRQISVTINGRVKGSITGFTRRAWKPYHSRDYFAPLAIIGLGIITTVMNLRSLPLSGLYGEERRRLFPLRIVMYVYGLSIFLGGILWAFVSYRSAIPSWIS